MTLSITNIFYTYDTNNEKPWNSTAFQYRLSVLEYTTLALASFVSDYMLCVCVEEQAYTHMAWGYVYVFQYTVGISLYVQ